MNPYPPPPPPPPMPYPGQRPPGRPVNGVRIVIGIGIALAAHLLTLVVAAVGFAMRDLDVVLIGSSVFLFGQLAVFVGCMIAGIFLAARRDGGIGIGLLIGWAVGVLAAPAAGFGMCVVALEWT